MTIKDAFLLAALQGITEFLPISSSGHLVLAQNLLGFKDVPVLFDLILHLGTMIATIIVYYKIIWNILKDLYLFIFERSNKKNAILERGNLKLLLYIIISTIITGILGYLFKDALKSIFLKPSLVSIFLILTGLLLFITRFIKSGESDIKDLSFYHPVIIGIVQAVSIIPGISRSGSTISTGIFLGFKRDFSGMYSFLISIPSIFGASILEFINVHNELSNYLNIKIVITAFFVSLVVGYVSLLLLLRFLRQGKLYVFSFYCFAIGITSYTMSYFNIL